MYGNYSVALEDSDANVISEWSFTDVMIDYSRRGVAVINKKGRLVLFLMPSREQTLRIEMEEDDSSHITKTK